MFRDRREAGRLLGVKVAPVSDVTPVDVRGRKVVLVDDGLATGATVRSAVRAIKPIAPSVVVAAPVGASATCAELRQEADEVVTLEEPVWFYAVGQWYRDFRQVTDDEVRALL